MAYQSVVLPSAAQDEQASLHSHPALISLHRTAGTMHVFPFTPPTPFTPRAGNPSFARSSVPHGQQTCHHPNLHTFINPLSPLIARLPRHHAPFLFSVSSRHRRLYSYPFTIITHFPHIITHRAYCSCLIPKLRRHTYKQLQPGPIPTKIKRVRAPKVSALTAKIKGQSFGVTLTSHLLLHNIVPLDPL